MSAGVRRSDAFGSRRRRGKAADESTHAQSCSSPDAVVRVVARRMPVRPPNVIRLTTIVTYGASPPVQQRVALPRYLLPLSFFHGSP